MEVQWEEPLAICYLIRGLIYGLLEVAFVVEETAEFFFSVFPGIEIVQV